jgi:hypothetical protein
MDEDEIGTRVSRVVRQLRRMRRKSSSFKYTFQTRKHNPKEWHNENHKYGLEDFRKNDVNMDIEEFKGEVKNEFFLAASSLNDHYITKILNERTEEGLPTTTVKEELVVKSSVWLRFIRDHYKKFQIVEFGESTGMVIDNEKLNFIDYTIHSNSTQVSLYGDKEFVDAQYKTLANEFTIATCHIDWIYSGDGSSVTIPLLPDKLPISEMYPFLGDESITDYYDRYMESSASILLLIGPPGTGKTTFIRGLLHHCEMNAIVTYDEKILERDYVFSRFIEDDAGVMVIEDADNFLKSRADGNTMMHRFLNVGDGLISMRGKKLIFSTNLPSIRDVDSALVRPGRCFDVVTFDNYTLDQARKLADKLGIKFEEKENKSDTYSLAEVFFKQRNASPKQIKKMGFV